MIRRIGLLVVALAFFSIAGGQWAVVQSVAWAGMLRDYTHQTGSFAVAVRQTFDGQHLCPLCRQIQAAKSQERKESPAAPGAKDDAKVKAIAADPVPNPVARPEQAVRYHPLASADASRRAEPPLTPPPRVSSQLAA